MVDDVTNGLLAAAPLADPALLHADPQTGLMVTRQAFPDLDAVYRAAVCLLDEKTEPHTRPAPPFRQLLLSFTP